MERAAEGLPSGYHLGFASGVRLGSRKIRRGESGRAEATARGRRGAEAVLAADHGSLPEGRERGLCRNLGRQRRLQEDLGIDPGLPQRPVSVVAGRGVLLRHLHDPDPAAQLSATQTLKAKPGASAPGFFAARLSVWASYPD